jgi:hypothetical protein
MNDPWPMEALKKYNNHRVQHDIALEGELRQLRATNVKLIKEYNMKLKLLRETLLSPPPQSYRPH